MVAFVYVTPIGDLGWTWAHDQARLAIELYKSIVGFFYITLHKYLSFFL